MVDKYIAILGGLVGSGFTILVTKIFDYFQTNQLHKLSLKKEFFLRKINVYEKTVSQLTIAHTTITNMAILIKTAQNENATFTEDQQKDIFARLNNTIQQIYKATQETAGSIDLYVDFKHDDKEVEYVEQFWELLGTINHLSYEINLDYDFLLKPIAQEDHLKIEDSINSKTKLLSEKIENLSKLSNYIRRKTLSMTAQLREELKKYE